MKIIEHTYSNENKCLTDLQEFLDQLNSNQVRAVAFVYLNRNDPIPKHGSSFGEIDRLNLIAMLTLLIRDLGRCYVPE